MAKLNNLFLTIADKVSYFMGTPANILIWILLVVIWIALGPEIAKSNFLPAWFTSNAFNFPLNTVTTLAELYIGFLVAAAANRSERNTRHLMEEMDKILEHVRDETDEILIQVKQSRLHEKND